ncbi:MAG TPA: DUF6412 domain-containing protein [Actinophytocola sp.]|nr:DUF6412 domain-containing protein [Actinophytocola sp.]
MTAKGEPMTRLRFVLAVIVPALYALLPAAGSLSPLGALTAGLAVAVVACVVLIRLVPAAAPAGVRTVRLRDYAWQAAFLRLRDPDARGRTRPRAPTRRSPAA